MLLGGEECAVGFFCTGATSLPGTLRYRPTPRTLIQETAISAQIVPGMQFLVLCSGVYELATQCPVLTLRMPICLRACYAVSGTKIL
eukprot:2718903-Rhodomonas_salina.2